MNSVVIADISNNSWLEIDDHPGEDYSMELNFSKL